MQRWEFRRYLLDLHGFRGQFRRDTEQLMADIGATDGQLAYKAEDYLKPVVDHWNTVYTGRYQFKAFIFGPTGRYKPLMKYGSEEYNVPILLYLDQGHFQGVQKTGNLFGMPYCLSCEKTYQRAATHNKDCKARCLKWYYKGYIIIRICFFIVLESVQHSPVNMHRAKPKNVNYAKRHFSMRIVIDFICLQIFVQKVKNVKNVVLFGT